MSTMKKMYVSPKYEMVKFDTKIMTVWSPNCFGVVSNDYDEVEGKINPGCTTSYDPNVLAVTPNYWP